MAENKVYLAWRDPSDGSWRPVGILISGPDRNFRFVYTRGARSAKNFVPFNGMEDLESVYESDRIFPLFSNRLLSASRPEYGQLLGWLNIKENEGPDFLLKMLAATGGIRATDTLEVFRCPAKNADGQYEVHFFSHGLRHVSGQSLERLNRLSRGERLFLAMDEQNERDELAVALRTADPLEFAGYCPRYLCPDVRRLLEKNEPSQVIVTVEKVNPEAPLNLRLLCRLEAPWPPHFQPCSAEAYQPLVDYSNQAYHPASGIYRPEEVIVEKAAEPKTEFEYNRRQKSPAVAPFAKRNKGSGLAPVRRVSLPENYVFPSGKTWKIQNKSARSETEQPGGGNP
jgi:hypothetical protein